MCVCVYVRGVCEGVCEGCVRGVCECLTAKHKLLADNKSEVSVSL